MEEQLKREQGAEQKTQKEKEKDDERIGLEKLQK